MKHKQQIWTGTLCALAMLVLILDAKTAVSGGKEGIELCLRTVIPALFPFFVLSIMINSALVGSRSKLLEPIGKLCGIPAGAESLLILGLFGGYPVGAQGIIQAWQDGRLHKEDAKRMLGFCNNAGPAFLFGMAASLLTSSASAWILWGIHILSALMVGIILPNKSVRNCKPANTDSISFVSALERSIKIMATVCGWVIIFRVVLAFLNTWFLWFLSSDAQIAVIGLLELSNGCIELRNLSAEGGRFLFMAAFLGFGGLCVGAQTVSVTKALGTGYYFPGKVIQGIISILLAYIAHFFLFPAEQIYQIPFYMIIALAAVAVCTVFLLHSKKTVAFHRIMMYNKKKYIS